MNIKEQIEDQLTKIGYANFPGLREFIEDSIDEAKGQGKDSEVVVLDLIIHGVKITGFKAGSKQFSKIFHSLAIGKI